MVERENLDKNLNNLLNSIFNYLNITIDLVYIINIIKYDYDDDSNSFFLNLFKILYIEFTEKTRIGFYFKTLGFEDFILDLIIIFNFKDDFEFFWFTYNNSIQFALKLMSTLIFLILIRAGLPRYRYDFVTKLGWKKFLIITIIYFILLILFYSFF